MGDDNSGQWALQVSDFETWETSNLNPQSSVSNEHPEDLPARAERRGNQHLGNLQHQQPNYGHQSGPGATTATATYPATNWRSSSSWTELAAR